MMRGPAAATIAAMTKLTITLHGASGAQGAPLARRLLRAGHRVRAAIRRPELAPEGCEPFPADLSETERLARAYDGADAVVVQLPNVFDATAIAQAESVAEALRRSPVEYVVLSAGGPIGGTGLPYLEARTMVAEHVSATIEPHAPHMDNLAAPWSAQRVATGVLGYPLPAEAPIPWIAIGDIADRIVAAIEGRERGRIKLCGPRPLTGDQAAAAIARAIGRPVGYRALTPAAFGDLMRPYTGDATADGIAGLYTAMHSAPPPSFEGVRPCPTEMADWAATQAWTESVAA
jgi:uncharacterized protein YbjT (DUF2867 family)